MKFVLSCFRSCPLQYSKDAVNCVSKKVRKYRKKLDKIAATEKLDQTTLNPEQSEMIRTKKDTIELFEEFSALEAEIKSLKIPAQSAPQVETKEIVVEKVVEKIIEKAPADLPDTELQTKFNYLHANGLLLDADFTDWLKAAVSDEDLQTLREWVFSLVSNADKTSSSRLSFFANEVKKLGQKSDECPENCSVSYKTIASWIEKISVEVDLKEREVALQGGSQRFLEQAKQEAEKQQQTAAATTTKTSTVTTAPAAAAVKQSSSQGKAAPKKARAATASPPADPAPAQVPAPEEKPDHATATSPPAAPDSQPGEKLSFWGTPVVPSDPNRKPRPVPKKPAAVKPEADAQGERKDKGKGKGQGDGKGKGSGKF